jgi:hypothetical protein
MRKDINSEALAAIYEMAKDLHEIGLLNDAEMQEYDEGCLVVKKRQKKERKNSGYVFCFKTFCAGLCGKRALTQKPQGTVNGEIRYSPVSRVPARETRKTQRG